MNRRPNYEYCVLNYELRAKAHYELFMVVLLIV